MADSKRMSMIAFQVLVDHVLERVRSGVQKVAVRTHEHYESFLVLIGVLVLRPSGLLGERVSDRA